VARLQLIGVDFDSCAHDGGVADAATELRRLGLIDRLALRHDVVDWGELITSAPVAERGEGPGLMNEAALLLLLRRLRDAVGYGLGEDATPVVYGADCAVLPGALAGARGALGEVGLVFVDGHEDALGLEASPDGRADRSALALALGLAGERLPAPLGELPQLVCAGRLALLGPRDRQELAALGQPSLRDRLGEGLRIVSDEELRAAGCAAAGREAALVAAGGGEDLRAGRPGARAGRWWLHVDLDVLSAAAFPAQDFYSPGGLSWGELLEVVTAALGVRGCCGVSLVGYDPELDGERVVARLIVDLTERLAVLLP